MWSLSWPFGVAELGVKRSRPVGFIFPWKEAHESQLELKIHISVPKLSHPAHPGQLAPGCGWEDHNARQEELVMFRWSWFLVHPPPAYTRPPTEPCETRAWPWTMARHSPRSNFPSSGQCVKGRRKATSQSGAGGDKDPLWRSPQARSSEWDLGLFNKLLWPGVMTTCLWSEAPNWIHAAGSFAVVFQDVPQLFKISKIPTFLPVILRSQDAPPLFKI